MNKYLKYGLLFLTLIFIGIVVYFVMVSKSHTNHSDGIYTCPMHPEIIRNEPGNCPICKMHLVELQSEHKSLSPKKLEEISLPNDQYIVGNFITVTPIDTTLKVNVSLPGTVAYDLNSAVSVAARISGRIEKMYVKYKFQAIQKGEKLFEIYSSELLTEQQNFIYIVSNDKENKTLIEASKQKLSLFGMTNGQIINLEKTKKIIPSIAIYSPISGIVVGTSNNEMAPQNEMQNNQNTTSLNIKEGSYIQKNEVVFKIQKTNKIWAIFNVLQEYSPLVKMNIPIKITTELDNKTEISGKVNFIETQLKTSEKTNRIRVYLDNSKLKLPVGTRLNGNILSNEVNGIFISKGAFVSLGNKKVVFIKDKQFFYAKEIKIGLQTSEFVQILSGLDTNDTIAENAQYLVDSESFIKIIKE